MRQEMDAFGTEHRMYRKAFDVEKGKVSCEQEAFSQAGSGRDSHAEEDLLGFGGDERGLHQ